MAVATQAFRQLNQTMDLVFVEQRGTTGSGLQTCPGLEDWLASPAAIQAAARRCLASASRDPRHDTTTLPGPGGQHQTLTITAVMVPGLVDVELSSIQTAVLLPAALHARQPNPVRTVGHQRLLMPG